MACSPHTISSGPTKTRTARTSWSAVDVGLRMGRRWPAGLLWLAFASSSGPTFANDALEPQVLEIERLSVSEHWRESGARIEALAAQQAALSPEQRQRVEYVRLHNLGVAGQLREALDGFSTLLDQEMPPGLKVHAFATAASIAANREDWPAAFNWLGEALVSLPEAPDDAARVLGVASYLYSLLGEAEKAREFALRGLTMVEGGGDQRAICQAVSDVALAEELAKHYVEAERWRRRQIDACVLAGDRIFTANAKYGVGMALAAQGRPADALAWAREGLAGFQGAGFSSGARNAQVLEAECLIETDRELDRAG